MISLYLKAVGKELKRAESLESASGRDEFKANRLSAGKTCACVFSVEKITPINIKKNKRKIFVFFMEGVKLEQKNCINKLKKMESAEIIRCGWCSNDPLYQKYHDQEWGKQIKDDQTLFEFLVLESAQAGLSWITILKKRENYRKAFSNFDYRKIAKYTQQDIDRLLNDPGIIRNRLKINSTIENAKIFMEIQKEFGSFYNYLYTYLPSAEPIINTAASLGEIAVTTTISDKISKDLKKRGMKFLGSTTFYAYMQATGMVNDHILSCSFR